VGAPRGRRTLSAHLRWRVMKRDRYRCVLCGRNPAQDSSVELHLDHVVPVSRGGTNEEGNLRTLCRECNQGRSDERPRGKERAA
jgi:5-methylcytosine-specific restriction endonuclease McrA